MVQAPEMPQSTFLGRYSCSSHWEETLKNYQGERLYLYSGLGESEVPPGSVMDGGMGLWSLSVFFLITSASFCLSAPTKGCCHSKLVDWDDTHTTLFIEIPSS